MTDKKQTEDKQENIVTISGDVEASTIIAGDKNIINIIINNIIHNIINHRIYYSKLLTLTVVISLCMGIFWFRVFDIIKINTIVELSMIKLANLEMGDLKLNPPYFHEDKLSAIIIKDKDYDKNMKEWREKYTEMIKKLTEAGARVIVFDIHFEEPIDTDIDTRLAESMRQAKKRGTSVVLSFIRLNENKKPYIADNFIKSVGDDYGFVDAKKIFGRVVKSPLFLQASSYSYSSLALKAFEKYIGGKISDHIQLSDLDQLKIKMQANNNICPDFSIRFSDFTIARPYNEVFKKGDEPETANLFIDFSPDDALKTSSDEEFNKLTDTDRVNEFSSKIVLVGVAEGDIHRTIKGERYGVHIQADIINTLLNNVYQGRIIHSLPEWLEYIFIAVFGIIGIIFSKYIVWWREEMDGRQLKVIISFIIIAFLMSCFLFSLILYIKARIVVNWMYYFSTYLLMLSVSTYYQKEQP